MAGTINAKTYAAAGFLLFGLKFLADRAVAARVFHRSWTLLDYLSPSGPAPGLLSIHDKMWIFPLTMVLLALPFIAIGIALTLKRLRSAGLPWWLIGVFFVPIVNIALFAALCVLPERAAGSWSPASAKNGLLFTAALGAVGFFFALAMAGGLIGSYGFGMFVAIPFTVSLIAVLAYSSNQERSFGSCVTVGCLTPLAGCSLLLLVGSEGAICLLMAAPLAAAIGFIAACVGYSVQHRIHRRPEAVALLLILVAFPPSIMAAEAGIAAPLLTVRSVIEINATPETVWRNVISFSTLPEPHEWIFRAGVAYPIRAEIRGTGPGATRFCVFSTGPFIEPITEWNEPRLLRFGIAQSPEPLREWSPYRSVHPRHLDGYLASRQGQFLLTPLPGGRTRLEGTTWYQHHMWPASYWQLWSDAVIHQIHMRVLQHIKTLSETSTLAAGQFDRPNQQLVTFASPRP